MSAPGLALALLLLTAPDGEPEDVGRVDAPERTALERRAETFEKRIAAPVPFSPKFRLGRGDARFVEYTLPLKRAPKGPLTGTLAKLRTTREVAFAGPVEVTVLRAPEVAAKIVFAVRALDGLPKGAYVAYATIELREGPARAGDEGASPAPVFASAPIELSLEIVDPEVRREEIELDRQAYLYHQQKALEAYGELPSLHDLLRLDRVDPPPSRSRVKPEQAAALDRFLRHRLRADIARTRLRAAVDASDPALSEAAILAIGSLSTRATGPAAKARIIEGVKPERALAMAKDAIRDMRFDEAEGILNVLRQRGGMTTEEVATDLALLSAVSAARGHPDEATLNAGRALCIDPKLKIAFDRPIFGAGIARARTAADRCTGPIVIDSVVATRRKSKLGPEVVVRVAYGPDPLAVVAGGEVEFWGSGGAVHHTARARAADGVLEVVVPDAAELQNYTGQLILKIALRELAGVVIARFGDPDPTPVALGRDESASQLDIPWWVWAVAGGVAVLGATAAVAITVGGRETQYGIGPIHAEF